MGEVEGLVGRLNAGNAAYTEVFAAAEVVLGWLRELRPWERPYGKFNRLQDAINGVREAHQMVGFSFTEAASLIIELEGERDDLLLANAQLHEAWSISGNQAEMNYAALQASEARVKELLEVLGRIAAGHQPPESIGVHWAQAYRGLQSVAQAALTSGGEGLSSSVARADMTPPSGASAETEGH